MQTRQFVPVLILAAFGAGGPSTQAAGAAVRLSEQTAVYDLELGEATHRSGLVSVRGRIALSMSGGGCSGWTNETRMVNDYFFRRRGHRMIDSRNTSWESSDGMVYRFASSRFVNGVKTRESRLMARREGGPQGEIKVSFSKPVERTTTLPAGTLFPTQATRRIIATAMKGGRILRFHVYEGFENGRARLVSVVIGDEIATAAPGRDRKPGASGSVRTTEKAPARLLAGLRAWPVSMAYYPATDNGKERVKKDFGLPEYEISFILHENGVLADPVLRYKDFTLKGKLVKLKLGHREIPCR
jgi:hypothetical protein